MPLIFNSKMMKLIMVLLCFVKDKKTGANILEGKLKQGLYAFDFQLKASETHGGSSFTMINLLSSSSHTCVIYKTCVTSVFPDVDLNQLALTCNSTQTNLLWHMRLGYPSFKTIYPIIQRNSCEIFLNYFPMVVKHVS